MKRFREAYTFRKASKRGHTFAYAMWWILPRPISYPFRKMWFGR